MKMSTDGLSEEIKQAINKYDINKNQIRDSDDKETQLIACSSYLSDIYVDIRDNENWQKSPCVGGEDTGFLHRAPSFFKSWTDNTKTNLQQFNSEVEFLVSGYQALPPPPTGWPKREALLSRRANMIKNFKSLYLAENKTDCALSVTPTSPANIYDNYPEYRLAKKIYLRTEDLEREPLRYINRMRPTREPKNIPIPTQRKIWDEKNQTHRMIPMQLSDFDELSGITEIKKLPITGKILNPEALDNLTTLMGKSTPRLFVPLSQLPEHIAEETTCCCYCTIL